jgi:hypothetical protein
MLAATAGCLKLDHRIVLNPDGSGAYEASYAVSEQSIERFAAMKKLRRQMQETRGRKAEERHTDLLYEIAFNPDEPKIRRALEKYEDSGIKITELSVESRNAWRQLELAFSFDSISELSKTHFFEKYGFRIYRNTRGSYVFHKPPIVSEEKDRIDPLTDKEEIRQITPLLSGFSVSTEVKLPGRVLDSNATERNLNTLIWTYDFDSDPNSIVKIQNRPMTAIFDPRNGSFPEVSTVRNDPEAD